MKKQIEHQNPLRVAVYARVGNAPPDVTCYSLEQDLLAVCRLGQVDHLIVESFTGLGRNIVESLGLLRELNGAGVKVHLIKEGWVV
jgi:hypothetical protein